MRFFVGLDRPAQAQHFASAFISVNTIRDRKSDFPARDWIMDSGAFSTILAHGGYPHPVEEYAEHVRRWRHNSNMLAAVAQDYMCETSMLALTGLTVAEHQRLTVERYDALIACRTDALILPVLQGQTPADFATHLEQYGARFSFGQWVGVGTMCKRKRMADILPVLFAIKRTRPDLRLHGFGLKTQALRSGLVRELLHSADSMSWSYAARRQGRNHHDWREAARFHERIQAMPYQRDFGFLP